jgi:L-amino acid N-acyltransferase YncA
MEIRSPVRRDTEAMLAIYAPYVLESSVSFEEELPTVDAFADRIESGMRTHPWLVAEAGGAVVGYAYASMHRARAAYRWSTEVSAYVSNSTHRSGVGRALYLELFERLRALGFVNAFAGITLPNDPSVGFHEALGFAPIGRFPKIGFKRGRWHDVGWWALRLREDDRPTDPRRP